MHTTSESFDSAMHPTLHEAGNAWVRRVWIELLNGQAWLYNASARRQIVLIKWDTIPGWIVGEAGTKCVTVSKIPKKCKVR